ncbi:MAG: F-box/LRR-repeat protein 2-like [Chlamydiales bacterium]|jgi:hypothetical protein|nr:F-box/LRR-repeat protein 2-like [Chlamydiales bacterium]
MRRIIFIINALDHMDISPLGAFSHSAEEIRLIRQHPPEEMEIEEVALSALEKSGESFAFNDLPYEVQLHIFSFAGVKALRISKVWRSIILQNSKLSLECRTPAAEVSVKQFFSKASKLSALRLPQANFAMADWILSHPSTHTLQELDLDGRFLNDQNICSLLKKIGGLKKLIYRSTQTSMGDAIIELIFKQNKELERLEIRLAEYEISDYALSLLSRHWPHLKHLFFQIDVACLEGQAFFFENQVICLVDSSPSEDTLPTESFLSGDELFEWRMERLLTSNPQLESIQICRNWSDRLMQQLPFKCPNLSQLQLPERTQVRLETLQAFAAHCTRLKEVSLINCSALTDLCLKQLAINNPRLERLALSGDQLTVAGLKKAVSLCPHLRALKVPNWGLSIDDEALEELLKIAPPLFHLSIAENEQLTDTSLVSIAAHSPQLITLDIRHLNQVTARGIRALLAAIPSLKLISLDFCSLTEEQLEHLYRDYPNCQLDLLFSNILSLEQTGRLRHMQGLPACDVAQSRAFEFI